MSKKTIAIIFDGASKQPAAALLAALPPERYFVLPVYITTEGKWLFYDSLTDSMNNNNWEQFGTNAVLSPDKTHRGFLRLVGDKFRVLPCDIVFALAQSVNVGELCQAASIACITEPPKRTKPAVLRQVESALSEAHYE